MRILVTGGSGFIGTNLVSSLLLKNKTLLSIDIAYPKVKEHAAVFQRVDILDLQALRRVVEAFQPTHVVHLAARTDLKGRTLADYAANTVGVQNLIAAMQQCESVTRGLFTSTKLVVPNASGPEGNDDYRPDTLYGQSKVMGEQYVKAHSARYSWCILRPTSIWGPWSGVPYGVFFKTVMSGLYFHPGKINPPRYFGYVGNAVHQIESLLEAPAETIQGQVYYLADYTAYRIKEWADAISIHARGRKVKTVPEALMRTMAKFGDLLSLARISFPITTFRLNNMSVDTTKIPLENIKAISGDLPYDTQRAVVLTVDWFKAARQAARAKAH